MTDTSTDGCTCAFDVYLDCCAQHDFAYRNGCAPSGQPLTRAEADEAFRQCIQAQSVFGVFSPMSWWRWAAVRLFGGSSWHGADPSS